MTQTRGAGQPDGKVAVITGATAGIGLAIAKHFAAEGAYVFVTRRGQPALDASAGLTFRGTCFTVQQALPCGGRRDEPGTTSWHPGRRARDIGMLTTASQAHYDDAVRPGRRSAQAAPSALARPRGA